MIKFVKLKNTDIHREIFTSLMLPYCKELDINAKRETPEKNLINFAHSIVNKSNDPNRFIELCYEGEKLTGFLYGKIDREGDRGYIRPDWGYVMEFYVKPEYRRKGYGEEMYKRLEGLFVSEGVSDIWLTADPVTGKPFWKAVGFKNSGKKSPENKLYIFEKQIGA